MKWAFLLAFILTLITSCKSYEHEKQVDNTIDELESINSWLNDIYDRNKHAFDINECGDFKQDSIKLSTEEFLDISNDISGLIDSLENTQMYDEYQYE